MPTTRNLIVGSDAGNAIQGTNQADLIYGFDPAGRQSQVSDIGATRIVTGLVQPLFAGSPPGDPSRLFVLEKEGKIKIVDLDTNQVLPTPFLDITADVLSTGERGLLGLAFDPDFATNGVFYVDIIAKNFDTEIRRYQVSASDPNVADPSGSLIARITQETFSNHKAGWIDFGPDGYLYVALGDGGASGDPNNNGQNPDTLMAKMLRIDVRSDAFPQDPLQNYAIPADNPFVGTAGRDEIFALGLRNPFRNSFDSGLGTFYIADVGQAQWEEVNIGEAGANYGWRVIEGPDSFQPGPLGPGVLTAPVHAYPHVSLGGESITGGYVYRGESDGLQGHYFFGDFVTGKIYTLHFDGGQWQATDRTSQVTPDFGTIDNIASFGEDGRRNLYLVDFDGEIFRLTPAVLSSDVADVLSGLAGDDFLVGGTGDDDLVGGQGADILNGGLGFDVARYSDAATGIAASLAVGRGAGGEAAGDLFVSIEGLVGSAFGDILVGSGGQNVLAGGDGNDVISGLAGADRIELGTGADIVRDRLSDLNGDRIGGVDAADAIDISGSLIGRANLGVAVTSAGANITAGAFSFQLDGSFSGGDFVTAARGTGTNAHTTVSFEYFLPDLSEGRRVDPAAINGVASEPFVTGDGVVAFTLEFKSAVSAFRNTVGSYKVSADGTIGDVAILLSNTLGIQAGRTVDLGVPSDGQKLGFFLVQGGVDIYGSLPNDLSFVMPGTATTADIDLGIPPVLRSATLGDLTRAPIFHSLAALNPGGANQVLSGVTPGGRELQIAFEDLPSSTGDNDFQDVVFGLGVSPDSNLIL